MEQLDRLLSIIQKMADPDLFLWLSENRQPTESEKQRAAAVIADRLCGNITDPIIRNAQEKRQLTALRQYLKHKGYSQVDSAKGVRFNELKPGEFSFRMNIPVYLNRGSERQYGIHIPINAVVQPLSSRRGDFPLLWKPNLPEILRMSINDVRRKHKKCSNYETPTDQMSALSYFCVDISMPVIWGMKPRKGLIGYGSTA